MNKLLGQTPLVSLLTSSIAADPVIRATASTVDTLLAPVVKAVPDMLMWARLWGDDSMLSPPLRRLVAFTGGLRPLSDNELELLAWEMHVDFWKPEWPRTVRENLVKNATRWHRIKGTPASIYEALSLFGLTATLEENGEGEQWASYQLAVPQAMDLDTIRLAVTICREMHPQRCSLWRMYTPDYDLRPGQWSGGFSPEEGLASPDYAPPFKWSDWLWSDYSGVAIPGIPGADDDHDLIISFGEKRSAQSDPWFGPDALAGFGHHQHLFMYRPQTDYPIWSEFVWSDSHFIQHHGFILEGFLSMLWADRPPARHEWTGLWDNRDWVEGSGLDRRLTTWSMFETTFSRSELLHADGLGPSRGTDLPQDATYSDINANYGVPHTTELRVEPWSAFEWSSDMAPIIKPIHERFARTSAMHVNQVDSQAPATATHMFIATGCVADERTPGFAVRSTLSGGPEPGERRAHLALIGEQGVLGETVQPSARLGVSGLAALRNEPLRINTWTDSWDQRQWSPYTVYFNILTEE